MYLRRLLILAGLLGVTPLCNADIILYEFTEQGATVPIGQLRVLGPAPIFGTPPTFSPASATAPWAYPTGVGLNNLLDGRHLQWDFGFGFESGNALLIFSHTGEALWGSNTGSELDFGSYTWGGPYTLDGIVFPSGFDNILQLEFRATDNHDVVRFGSGKELFGNWRLADPVSIPEPTAFTLLGLLAICFVVKPRALRR